MFSSRSYRIPIILFFFSVLLSSCFKDVDLSQSQNIALEPDIDVDLLYFQLNRNDFLDSETNEYSPIVRDTVRLEFFDDDYIQDGLQYAEFRFRHENRFPYEIKSNIKFLGENRRSQFNVSYIIPPGSATSPSVIDTIVIKQGNEINQVRRSIQMALQLEVIGADENIEGELEFQSKGLFKFEF